MGSQLDKVLAEIPKVGPRSRAEQRYKWKKALQEDLDCENVRLDIHNGYRVDMLINYIFRAEASEFYPWFSPEQLLNCYSDSMCRVFFSMHRIAYSEGLLNTESPKQSGVPCVEL